jgi:hypothetical protein
VIRQIRWAIFPSPTAKSHLMRGNAVPEPRCVANRLSSGPYLSRRSLPAPQVINDFFNPNHASNNWPTINPDANVKLLTYRSINVLQFLLHLDHHLTNRHRMIRTRIRQATDDRRWEIPVCALAVYQTRISSIVWLNSVPAWIRRATGNARSPDGSVAAVGFAITTISVAKGLSRWGLASL